MVKKLTGLVALIVALLVMPTMVSATSLKTTCDKSCPTEDGKCTATCTIKIEENTTSMTTFTGDLEIVGDGVTVTSFAAGEGWTKVSPTDAELSGKTLPISLMSTAGVSDANFTLATITLELESKAADCSLKLKNPSAGSEVTVEITTTTETKTGASLPIAIIAVGVVGATVIYATTKKNKKLYKI